MSTSSATTQDSTSPNYNMATQFTVHQFPCLQDNYGYLLHNTVTGETAAIDTPDAKEITKQLQQQQWKLTHIFNTHHHWDHTGGNDALHQSNTGCQIYGPASESIPHCMHPLQGGDAFDFGGTRVEVLDVGGHTKGHIAYYLPSQKIAFVGDALFALGCGRMFEGTPNQFWASLQRLRNLPDDTTVYCAHEYTMANGKFALSVEPSNSKLVDRMEQIQELRAKNQPTVPTSIGIEKETNPFLRCDVSDELRSKVGSTSDDTPEQVFAKVRAAKDHFRG
ncbi:hypothetical protein ACA910_001672 [Epithemia clementina (nom. ined.)]